MPRSLRRLGLRGAGERRRLACCARCPAERGSDGSGGPFDKLRVPSLAEGDAQTDTRDTCAPRTTDFDFCNAPQLAPGIFTFFRLSGGCFAIHSGTQAIERFLKWCSRVN